MGNRGLVNYESHDVFKRPFKSRVQESVAAFEARIAEELGLAAGTPRAADAAECATHAETGVVSAVPTVWR